MRVELIEEQIHLPIISPLKVYFKRALESDCIGDAVSKVILEQDSSLYDHHFKEFVKDNSSIEKWKELSREELSENMSEYQEYNVCDKERLNEEINSTGVIIPTGQYLFHGGFLNLEESDVRILERPFATSLSPGEALFHSTLASKAYDNEKIELLVLCVENISTKGKILFANGELLRHEFEILFAAGLRIKVVDKARITEDFKVKDCDGNEKNIPVDIVICNIS